VTCSTPHERDEGGDRCRDRTEEKKPAVPSSDDVHGDGGGRGTCLSLAPRGACGRKGGHGACSRLTTCPTQRSHEVSNKLSAIEEAIQAVKVTPKEKASRWIGADAASGCLGTAALVRHTKDREPCRADARKECGAESVLPVMLPDPVP
jgi:hypothetical protein